MLPPHYDAASSLLRRYAATLRRHYYTGAAIATDCRYADAFTMLLLTLRFTLMMGRAYATLRHYFFHAAITLRDISRHTIAPLPRFSFDAAITLFTCR